MFSPSAQISPGRCHLPCHKLNQNWVQSACVAGKRHFGTTHNTNKLFLGQIQKHSNKLFKYSNCFFVPATFLLQKSVFREFDRIFYGAIRDSSDAAKANARKFRHFLYFLFIVFLMRRRSEKRLINDCKAGEIRDSLDSGLGLAGISQVRDPGPRHAPLQG